MVNLLIKIDMLKKFWIKQTFLEQGKKSNLVENRDSNFIKLLFVV
jgi:hypothetical protein